MLSELPENTLITADAGFVGYDFRSAVMAAGHRRLTATGFLHHFLIYPSVQ
jgi:hypothetical protein